MKRVRSSSAKDSKEATTSSSKKSKPVVSTVESSPKHQASATILPTHGDPAIEKSPSNLQVLASKCISEIRQGLASIRKYKKVTSTPDESESAVSEGKRKILLALQFLKKLNRLSHLHCKDRRDLTQKVKSDVDDLHLQLQNLTYEYNHLLRETANCLEFKSQHEDVDLVDVDSFYLEAPEEISSPASTRDDEHKQMLARLEWELQERKRLIGEKDGLEQEITTLKEDIQSRQEYLDGLQPSLNTLLKTSLPVQELMDMPLNKKRDELEAARLLPVPLYILFVQLKGYSEAVDDSVKVHILGDTSEAESFLLQSSTAESKDSDGEDDMPDDEESDRKQRKDSGTKGRLLKPFPLQIELHIDVEKNISVTMVITYLTELKLVCLAVKGLKMPNGSEPESPESQSLLHHLLEPGDGGESLPPVAAAFLRQHRCNVSIREEYGHSYHWVHSLCGLKYLPTQPNTDSVVQSEFSQHVVDRAVRAVKVRVMAQIALTKQLEKLGALNLQSGEDDKDLFPPRIYTRLEKWEPVTGPALKAALQEFPSAVLFDGEEATNRFFQASFGLKDSSTPVALHCLVCVSIMYPSVPPCVALKVELTSNRQVHNIQLKEMEQELNVNFQHLVQGDTSGQNLLYRQMLKLQMCFDVYLTCCGVMPDGPLSKAMLPTKFKGPTKSYPFKYNTQTGTFHH